jgi:hypothetical protein
MGSEIENEFVNYDKYNAWGPVYQVKSKDVMQIYRKHLVGQVSLTANSV